jgi:lipid II:glycine glycyltransferase (peptidoglycan interpeptide bridge formation enzyme)
LIDQFLVPYEEMISRKGLHDSGAIAKFREVQRELQPRHKMRIFLARSGSEVCAGAIVSHLGERGIYHLGATGTNGLRTRASYVLQWRIIEWLKGRNCAIYDLHGVNRAVNPGVYEFKAGLCGKNGREVAFIGTFDACGSGRSRLTAKTATMFQQRRSILQNVKAKLRFSKKSRPQPAQDPQSETTSNVRS